MTSSGVLVGPSSGLRDPSDLDPCGRRAYEEEAARVQQHEFAERNTASALATLDRMTRVVVDEFGQAPFAAQRQVIEAFVETIEVRSHDHVHMRFMVPQDNGGLKLLVDGIEEALKARSADESDATGFNEEASDCRRGLGWLSWAAGTLTVCRALGAQVTAY